MIEGDLGEFCLQGAKGSINKRLLTVSDDWSICLVLASEGYPESPKIGEEIQGLDSSIEGKVYHAGTQREDSGKWITAGGRVLAVVASDKNRLKTVDKVYKLAKKVEFSKHQMRDDIGQMHF